LSPPSAFLTRDAFFAELWLRCGCAWTMVALSECCSKHKTQKGALTLRFHALLRPAVPGRRTVICPARKSQLPVNETLMVGSCVLRPIHTHSLGPNDVLYLRNACRLRRQARCSSGPAVRESRGPHLVECLARTCYTTQAACKVSRTVPPCLYTYSCTYMTSAKRCESMF